MRIPRFYINQVLFTGDRVALDTETNHYALRVLRLKDEASVILFNGQGGEYQGTLRIEKKGHATVSLEQFDDVNRESPINIELVQGICRGEKMDLVVQKAVELGVGSIVPVLSDYSDVKLTVERGQKRQKHWQNIAVNACQQSGRTQLPLVATPTPLARYFNNNELQDNARQLKLILDPHSTVTLNQVTETPQDIALLVGPEGGISKEELDQARRHGFSPVRLGPRTLRSETAPLAALAVLNYVWGDYR